MADFELAVEVVLRHEGEYSEDHAGATKWGAGDGGGLSEDSDV